jgi:predicted short-subunit dehydrogenase-like oxidoreductase (DUF2520 family)
MTEVRHADHSFRLNHEERRTPYHHLALPGRYTASMLPRINAGVSDVAIAGAGPVAQALGRALQECGIGVGCIASRNLNHAKAAAVFIGGGALAIPYCDIPLHASHVLVAVSDRAIAPVAEELAKGNGRLRVALHTCGSYGPEALAALNAVGVSCGGIHPLQTIRDASQGTAALRSAAFAVFGDSQALSWAEEIATALGGHVLHIRPDARHLYHAAAVMASNYIAALMDSAEQLMLLAGVPKEDALRALAPLARTSIDNVVHCGAVEALTGPVMRGDAATVTEHVRAMERAEPSIAELYKVAGLHALRMARRRGLGDEEAESVHRALLGRR